MVIWKLEMKKMLTGLKRLTRITCVCVFLFFPFMSGSSLGAYIVLIAVGKSRTNDFAHWMCQKIQGSKKLNNEYCFLTVYHIPGSVLSTLCLSSLILAGT